MVLWQRLTGVGHEGEKGKQHSSSSTSGGTESAQAGGRPNVWGELEGRNVWEAILGKKEDELVIG